ncbi:hypothetical protein SEPCBS119000_000093 [Sporothrix epigloea]|uniref:Uncharacterized protein n=1 Tax=Sporothrix epigloea TaxID=1892477 RepID=A0ABP0D372_9PEZI
MALLAPTASSSDILAVMTTELVAPVSAAMSCATMATTPAFQTKTFASLSFLFPPLFHNHANKHSRSLRLQPAALVRRVHNSAARAWMLAAIAAQPILWLVYRALHFALRIAAALVAVAQTVLRLSWQALCQAFWWHLWACPSATRLRKRLYLELGLTIMGPSGNGVLLVVLWPGWLVLAAGIWGLSTIVPGA